MGGGGISVRENVLLVILSGIGSLHRLGHSVANRAVCCLVIVSTCLCAADTGQGTSHCRST